MRAERRKPTRHRDSGAVAVEAGVVSMLLVVLLFGVIETSYLFKNWLSVSAAARAGARMAASQPKVASLAGSPDFAQLSANQVTNAITGLVPANIEAVWVYKASPTTGLPDSGSFASCSVCVKFAWNAGTSSLTPLIGQSSSWAASTQNACSSNIPTRDTLGVYVRYKNSSPLGFFFKETRVNESTVMWLEPSFSATGC